jgi:hypothetical protein
MNKDFPHIRDIIKYTLEYNSNINDIKLFLIKNQPPIGTDADFPKINFENYKVKAQD